MITLDSSETRYRTINGRVTKLDYVQYRGLSTDVPSLPTEGIENMSVFIAFDANQPPAIYTFNLETKTWQKNSKEE